MFEFVADRHRAHRRRLPASCSLVVDLRFLGAYVTGLNLVLLGARAPSTSTSTVSPLPPALQSAWLVIHVFVAMPRHGVLRHRRRPVDRAAAAGQAREVVARTPASRFLDTLPGAERLEDLAYRIIIVGFVLWTFTLIAGAIWAETRLGPLLGLGHQRGLDLHHLGASSPGTSTPARRAAGAAPVGVAGDHRLRRRHVQLHRREPVLQGSARLHRSVTAQRRGPPVSGRPDTASGGDGAGRATTPSRSAGAAWRRSRSTSTSTRRTSIAPSCGSSGSRRHVGGEQGRGAEAAVVLELRERGGEVRAHRRARPRCRGRSTRPRAARPRRRCRARR